MRLVIVSAGAALALAACGTNNQSANTANLDENLAAESIVSNDVTAIDAVTGDSANMAADVNYAAELANEPGNGTNAAAPAARPSPRTPAPGKPPLETPTPANTSSNSAE